MTLSEALILFAIACAVMAAPFAGMIWRDLKNNPRQELEA
jgi:hypothetical protein